MNPQEKLTVDLKPGEFIGIANMKYQVLDVLERRGRVELFVARADIDTGRIEILNVPISWITVIEHPPMPHLVGLLPG
jgi:hypothetical protein